jgi:3-oxoacyl-[acyl-carrier-protein] synthase III
MRWDSLYVAGLGSYLPEQVQTADEAVAAGLYDAASNEANGIRSVRVSGPEETGPVMAVAAARQAIARSGHSGEDFGLVLHACMGHQGRDLWTPAHYIQNEAVGGAGAAMEVNQSSNSGMAAFELAASYIAGRSDVTTALVTSADAFHLPYVNRWACDDQTVYGDGAGAVVLSSRSGFARVVSSVSHSDASLEPIYRGTEEWTRHPFADGRPIDTGIRKRGWLARDGNSYDQAVEAIKKNFGATLQQALDEAGTELGRTQWMVHANVSEPIATWGFYGALGIDRDTTPYDWGLGLGHIGGADQLIGLNHLVEQDRIKAGDLVVVVSVGLGFMWTVAVLEMLEPPRW